MRSIGIALSILLVASVASAQDESARIWKAGCIIRAKFLDSIMRAYEERPDLPNLLLASEFSSRVKESQAGQRSGKKRVSTWDSSARGGQGCPKKQQETGDRRPATGNGLSSGR